MCHQRYATLCAYLLRRPFAPHERTQVPLEVAELHPASTSSSCSLRPAATLRSSSSGVSIKRRASITFSRASLGVRPWLRAPGTSTTRATIHPSSSGSSYVIVSRSFSLIGHTITTRERDCASVCAGRERERQYVGQSCANPTQGGSACSTHAERAPSRRPELGPNDRLHVGTCVTHGIDVIVSAGTG